MDVPQASHSLSILTRKGSRQLPFLSRRNCRGDVDAASEAPSHPPSPSPFYPQSTSSRLLCLLLCLSLTGIQSFPPPLRPSRGHLGSTHGAAGIQAPAKDVDGAAEGRRGHAGQRRGHVPRHSAGQIRPAGRGGRAARAAAAAAAAGGSQYLEECLASGQGPAEYMQPSVVLCELLRARTYPGSIDAALGRFGPSSQISMAR